MDDLNRVRFSVTCHTGETCIIYFEPTGGEYALHDDDQVSVQIAGLPPGQLELTYGTGSLTVGAWLGATLQAWNKNGDEIVV